MTEEKLFNEDGQEFGKGRRIVAHCKNCGHTEDSADNIGKPCPICNTIMKEKSIVD